jgi:hypothetical protein
VLPCTAHPQIDETAPCAGCGRPFCESCLAEILGRRLCADCKQHAVQNITRRPQQHPLALWSVLVPAIGYFLCLVPVTSSIGLYLSWKTLRELRDAPHLSGRSAALAGMVISAGSLGTLLLAVGATAAIYAGR